MYRKPIGPTAHGVIDYAFATVNTLRASVKSTEAANEVVARFGVVGPKRATRLSVRVRPVKRTCKQHHIDPFA
jgi:hypothetical protein